MSDIPIYDSNGNQVDLLHIKDEIEYVEGRVSKSKNCYYKGIGIPYTTHFIPENKLNEEYDFVEKNSIFYIGLEVSKKTFKNKFGIFQEKYQDHFLDWIGCCSTKELNMLENLYDEHKFEKNSVDVLEYFPVNESEGQYYLKVQYHCGRISYVDNPNHVKLRELLDYMIQTNWNFPWDKNCISDISTNGLVTDVADIFYSEELLHKIGTVYSILYSLGNTSPILYSEFCALNGLANNTKMDYILNTLSLLSVNGVDISPLIINNNVTETYKNVVKNYLIQGKNCGFCGVGSCLKKEDSNQSYGEMIRKEYIERVGKMLG
jgi:hypothetical protein